MSNPYFSFKQFTVYHDKCAMKVGMDGVALGAWADISNTQNILDIGTGSGLIALMMAQRSNAQIDAIDIEPGAITQASLNVLNSPWKDRIKLIHSSLQHFSSSTSTRYDLIVCNPPFFSNSLKTPGEERTIARHTEELNHFELIDCAQLLLTKTGRIALILPVKEAEQIIDYSAKKCLYCKRKVYLLPKPNAAPKRILLELSSEVLLTETLDLIIETEIRHNYTPEFSELVRDFYLKL